MSLKHGAVSFADNAASLFSKNNTHFELLFQKVCPHWHFCYADGENISALYHIFSSYSYRIKWYNIPISFIWVITMPGMADLNFLKAQETICLVRYISKFYDNKIGNHNSISPGKICPSISKCRKPETANICFSPRGASFPLLSSLLFCPTLFSPYVQSVFEPYCLWPSLTPC